MPNINEAIAEYVAACWMQGNELPIGSSIEFDHCFGDESTDAKNPRESWTRVRAEILESHMDRAYEIYASYGYPAGEWSGSIGQRMLGNYRTARTIAELTGENTAEVLARFDPHQYDRS